MEMQAMKITKLCSDVIWTADSVQEPLHVLISIHPIRPI